MSEGHIVFAGVHIFNILDDIEIDTDIQQSTNAYTGKTGSNTEYISETGKKISFSNIVPKYESSSGSNAHKILDYKNLARDYKQKTGVLVSNSWYGINGNYKIIDFKVKETLGNNFEINWVLQEVNKFNKTKKTFRTFGKKTSSKTSKKKTKTVNSGSKADKNTKYLLKKCGTLKNGSNKKCVKILQKFLQSHGYYKGYKIDGLYQKYTEIAVKKLQEKYKIKVTKKNKGIWESVTKKYFIKKYKL